MNKDKYVFSQLIAWLDNNVFERIVRKYDGNKSVRVFSCWNQMLVMMFGQLSGRTSLRDMAVVMKAHRNKCYHLGFGKCVEASTISRANEVRDYHIFQDFATHMISVARRVRADCELEVKVDGNVYAFDSSIISLSLGLFKWAKFKYGKSAVKLHTLFDVQTQIPGFVVVTEASVNDMPGMDFIDYESGSYYVFDRGYNDFARLYKIQEHESYFVVRAKEQLKFRRIYSIKREKDPCIKADQIGVFTTGKSPERYPGKIRRIKYYDIENNRQFLFLTNDFDSDASTITELYRLRWGVELFFKWIKQHLKIKSFWGTSPNAVKIQVYVAVIAYCLVAIVAKSIKTEKSVYEILQIIVISLLDKTPINELLTDNINKLPDNPNDNLLLFN